MEIRPAQISDLPRIGFIYNHVVENCFAIFQNEPISEADLQAWFDSRASGGYPFIVAERDGEVVGFATYGPFRSKSGYALTVENAVHVAPDQRGRGIGTKLMQALLTDACERGFHAMVAGIDGDNEGSIRMHRRLGFEIVGRMPEIARKRGEWRTLVLMQKVLA